MKLYSPVNPRANHHYALNTDVFSVDVDPLQPPYRAITEVVTLGPITVARVEANASVVHRKAEAATDSRKHYSLIVAFDGEVMLSHHLGMSELKPGDFILMDNTVARSMFVHRQVSLLLIRVPEQVLQRFIPEPAQVEAQKMTIPAAQTPFYEPVLTLWDAVAKNHLKEFAPTLAEKLLSTIAELYSTHATSQGRRASKRMVQVKKLIEEQLGNPELTVESLASAVGVSTRYLREMFSKTEKISHYILRRRLEECANHLANVLHQNDTITAIAFQYGFNSNAHFSRTFRKQYGLTPREYRNKYMQKSAEGVTG